MKWGTDKEVGSKASPGRAYHIGIPESRGTEQHSPSTSGEAKKADLAFVRRTRESLRKEIRAVVFGCAMRDLNLFRDDSLAYEMMLDVNVFGSRVKLVVMGIGNGRLVVVADDSRIREWVFKISG